MAFCFSDDLTIPDLCRPDIFASSVAWSDGSRGDVLRRDHREHGHQPGQLHAHRPGRPAHAAQRRAGCFRKQRRPHGRNDEQRSHLYDQRQQSGQRLCHQQHSAPGFANELHCLIF